MSKKKHGSLQNQFFSAKERCPGLQCGVCTRAIHTNNTIKKNTQQTIKILFEKYVGPEKGRLLQLGYRRSTSLVEYVAIQLLRLNRRAFLMLL